VRDRTLDGLDRGEGKRPRWLVSRDAVRAELRRRLPQQDDLVQRVAELEEENSRLRAEVSKLTAMAQNSVVAAQAAMAVAQQALLPTFPPAAD